MCWSPKSVGDDRPKVQEEAAERGGRVNQSDSGRNSSQAPNETQAGTRSRMRRKIKAKRDLKAESTGGEHFSYVSSTAKDTQRMGSEPGLRTILWELCTDTAMLPDTISRQPRPRQRPDWRVLPLSPDMARNSLKNRGMPGTRAVRERLYIGYWGKTAASTRWPGRRRQWRLVPVKTQRQRGKSRKPGVFSTRHSV